MFKLNDIVLFQGDSITDAGRDREAAGANVMQALGYGYVSHVAAELMLREPSLGLRVYDRGVGGDKVYQLADRWEPDCLALRPGVLSVLVGVNDYYHNFLHGTGGTVAEYENDYDTLLERTCAELPGIRLILGEPFLLKAGDITEAHVEGITAYRDAARRIAEKYRAVWVPYQRVFNEALKDAPAEYWAPDGVHPTPAGHMLMARAWLAAVVG
jgi:lysophospholipase L1-like esterase